jgi:DNA-binding LacI/PurR family transcriptional regulator
MDAMLGRYGLLLNQDAPPGMMASFVDSISIDDYSGGVAAAEWLGMQGNHRSVWVLAGPRHDPRSQRRVDGFLVQCPAAEVVWADGWYLEDGLRVADQVAAADAVFCGNDRLAEALIHYCISQRIPVPVLIGFDDAPIAAELGISTVAIPWDEMARAAVQIASRRLLGEPHPASRMVIAPRPISRDWLGSPANTLSDVDIRAKKPSR